MNQLPPPPSGAPLNAGVLADLIRQLRLIWRLYFDQRVPLWLKTIPTATLLYILSPIDFIPELAAPLIGSLDDLGALVLGLTTFINLCPPDIVKEHMQNILGETNWRVVTPDSPDDATPKVIDAPYTVGADLAGQLEEPKDAAP